MFDRIFYLVETFFGEEAFVSVWALGMYGASVKSRQHSISEAPIVTVLDVDDFMLLGEELW